MGMVTRTQMRSYLECENGYFEIGEGFTEFTEQKNPIEYARQYIHETTERTDLVGFSTSIAFAFDVYEEDPVHQKLFQMMKNETISSASIVTIVTVYNFGDGITMRSAPAIQRRYTLCPAKIGTGTEALICSGTLKACSQPIGGTFDMTSRTFQPA